MAQKARLAVAIGLVFITLALAACQGQATPTPLSPTLTTVPATAAPVPPTATSVTEPTATPPSAESILQAAFDASPGSAYRFDTDTRMKLSGPDIEEGTEIPMRFTGDFLSPDRTQGTITISINGVDTETKVIVMGDAIYAQNPLTGRWQVNPQATTLFNPKDLITEASAISGLELIGEETVDGMPAYHLTGQARLPFSLPKPVGQVEADMLVHYWVSREGLRVVRSTVEGDMNFPGEIQASATLTSTMRLLDSATLLEISAPEVVPTTSISVPGVGPIAITATLLSPLQSDTPEGHLQRGLASLADGRIGLARAHFDQAQELRPDWADPKLYRAATLAIDGDMDTALTELDRAIEAQPNRADAYALRAWAYLRALVREAAETDTVLPKARADIARALALDPKLTAAAGLKASADVWEALSLFDSDPAKAEAQLEAAKSDLEKVLRQDPGAASSSYLTAMSLLASRKAQDRAWLNQQADKASEQLSKTPESYVDYGERGVAKLFLGSQPTPELQTLQEAGNDLLVSIALAHDHMSALADAAGGPLQVARIWELTEAAYTSGDWYRQVFFNQNPQMFPEFAHMLANYSELHDLFAEVVDDPIIFDVAFSPDGRQIATLSESGPSYLRLWDAASGEKLREVELNVEKWVIATTAGNLAYSPDGTRVAVAYTNPVVRVIDTATGEVTTEITHTHSVHSVAFSPDGKRIVTVDPDTKAPVVWDAETGQKLLTLKAGSPVGAAAFSPDGRQIVGGGEKVQLWNSETGETLGALPGYASSYVSTPAISPDGRLLAVPGSPARVYDLKTKKELFTIPAGAQTVAFSPDGTRIATGGFDVAGVWDAKTGDLILLAGHPYGADSAAFSPGGRLLVTGGPDGRYRVWDAKTGAELSAGMAATLWWEASPTAQLAPTGEPTPAPPPTLTPEKALYWQRYDVDVDVQQSGELRVTETQELVFTRGTFRWGQREIPFHRLSDIRDVTVSEEGGPYYMESDSGEPYTYSVTRDDGTLKIRYNFPPSANTRRTIVIAYTVDGALRYYADQGVDRLAWAAIPAGNPFLTERSVITLHVPKPAFFTSYGLHGAESETSFQPDQGDAAIRVKGPIAAGQEVEAVAEWQHGVVAGTPQPWQRELDEGSN
jgi:WD40 repeat protein